MCQKPPLLRILGVDYGDRHLGLAVSDKLHYTAQPIASYNLKNEKADREFFRELVAKYEIGEIVIGWPLRLDGTEGRRVEKTREFARWLESVVNLPILFWDERLSTHEAYSVLNRQKLNGREKKAVKDSISASIILMAYLEKKRAEAHVLKGC